MFAVVSQVFDVTILHSASTHKAWGPGQSRTDCVAAIAAPLAYITNTTSVAATCTTIAGVIT